MKETCSLLPASVLTHSGGVSPAEAQRIVKSLAPPHKRIEQVNKQVLAAYKAGAMHPIERAVRLRLEIMELTDKQIARNCGVDRSAVTRWRNGGKISIENLFMIWVWQGWNLEELATREEQKWDGLKEAIHCTGEKLLGFGDDLLFSDEVFKALELVFCGFEEWVAARSELVRGNPDPMDRLIQHIKERISDGLPPPHHLRTLADFENVLEHWGNAWVLCVAILGGEL